MPNKPEQDLSNAIRLAVGSLPHVRLWRNNTGTIKDSRGVPVSFGLAKGSADCVGLVAPYGRFLSVEVKETGFKPPSEKSLTSARSHRGSCRCDSCHYNRQTDWRDIINRFGGVAGIVDSVDGALRLVDLATLPTGDP